MRDGVKWQSKAYGKTDLLNTIREMIKDGYSRFEIKET